MDMGESSEAETSAGESSAIDYDVFLSFRGPDSRQGFTDYLYHDMLEANIRVFFDEEELHVGKEIADELSTAIEKSKIYIPIFSKGYASSAWCLRELAHMFKCKESKPLEKKEIMPIFYDVKPKHVKLKSQLYVDALNELEKKFSAAKKFDPKTRREWENALKSAAQIKGWKLQKQGYWNFIKSVIHEIVMKLKTKDKYVAEYLVGMDNRVEAVLKKLDMDSGDMRFVLIHGMGGVGKTTLAKIVFNKLNHLFSHCCFLGNVRESSVGDIVNLQKQLLSNTLGSAFLDKINDVEDGIKVIAQRLSNKNLFIVLDDVDDDEQLVKLGIKHVLFGSGSRVILTTRKKDIIKADKTWEYEVNSLDPVQSLELFIRHAFRGNPPPNDFDSLSRQIVSTTGGLPFALEVIGSLLYRKNKASWRDVLEILGQTPNEKVEKMLKISYDDLSHQQKQIFLDIACHFVDENTTNAIYMWDDCRYGPNYSIDVLVCMSLIKITNDNKFWMHDQLKDFGRKIVRGDMRPMDLKEQRRIWVHETGNKIIRAEEGKEAKAIVTICLGANLSYEAILFGGNVIGSETYTSKEFSRLPNIRFLELIQGKLEGDFENQLSELRYMSWRIGSQEFLAVNFHPSNLVVLDLSYSLNMEDWAGWSQIKVAKKLKVLDLSHCYHLTRTPNFSDYLCLERLILKDCWDLIEVDDSLEKLNDLIYFDARGCTSLRKLPEGIGGLEKLEYLYLSWCGELRKLPESFVRVTSLVELDLFGSGITRLPDSIGNQKHLTVLKLGYTKLEQLPSSIGNLRKLKSLDLANTKIRELPVSIGKLESLLELSVSGTHCLRLPESIGDLSRLKIIDISNSFIRELPRSIVKLKELEVLQARFCRSLEWEIPEDIRELLLLRVLDLDFTLIRNVPKTIKLLPSLETLGLCVCSIVEPLPELPTSIMSLNLPSTLQWVPDLSNLPKLVTLSYEYYRSGAPFFFRDDLIQQSLMFLRPSLSTLRLCSCKSTTSLSFRHNMRNLTKLYTLDCRWKEVQLDGLEQLIEFKVEGLGLLEGFAGLSRLKRLKLLRLNNCPNLTALQGLGSVESLEQLNIRACPKVESLDDLSDLKKLESLSIVECKELVAVEGLDELEKLTNLVFMGCRSLRSFRNVFNWKVPDKCSLTISECPNLGYDKWLEFEGTVSDRTSNVKSRKNEGKKGKRRVR